MKLKHIIDEVDKIYKQMFMYGKNNHSIKLKEYICSLGLNEDDTADLFFDILINDNVIDKYKKTMTFTMKRELVENWFINTYGIDYYNQICNSL
jgi:hypothetical protein